MLKKLLIITLLTLVSVSTYSQRIRTIGSDTFVTFTRQQAKAINDTFVSQKNSIARLKAQDSISLLNGKQLVAQDSIRKVKDSITYYNQLLPELAEIKMLLVSQIETPFKGNLEIGAGAGASTYFGAYRPFSEVANGKYYIPSGTGVLKYNFHKHLTSRFEVTGTKVSAGPISKQLVVGTLLVDYNIAPNMYSIRVGMIPTVSVGVNVFGLTDKSLLVGAGIKSYFTASTALEVNVRYGLTNLDDIGSADTFIYGHLILTKRIL
jgi:uncharacterized protein YlzI (FlbEa/FlbD family)